MKNVLIFGDSYSTHKDYIQEKYPFYYCTEGRPEGPDITKMKVEETWWHRVISAMDGKLVLNDSWSGSTIGYIGWGGADGSKSFSFIHRFRKLKEQGFFKKNKINTVFIFGGTNDSWADAPLGENKFENWEEKDLYTALPAISYFINLVKTELRNADVYVIINYGLKREVEDCLRKSAQLFGAKAVDIVGAEKEYGHPTILGMKTISERVLEVVKSSLK